MHALDREVSMLMRAVATGTIMPRYQSLAAHEIAEKSPGDLVTIADHESEERLAEGLSRLIPEARIIGEEAVAADPSLLDHIAEGVVWLIDPLDGTMNFTEGRQPFAVMIGLLVDGRAEAGWILDPCRDRMCHAAHGKGAFVDGERIYTRPTGNPLPVAAIAPYFLPPERRMLIEMRAAGRLDIVAIPRCAGEQYPRLALGQNDVALFEKTLPWDHVPGALLLEEAGGMTAWPDGRCYRVGLEGKGLIGAASPALWEEAARILDC